MLANVLTFDDFWGKVGPQLDEHLFAVEAHRRLFRFMELLAADGIAPTLATVYRRMIESKTTPEQFGFSSVSAMAFDALIRIVDPTAWVRGLKRVAAARATWRAAERLRLGVEAGVDVMEDVAAAREELRRLEPDLDGADHATATVGDTLARIGLDALFAEPRGLVASPWDSLNGHTNGGMRPGEVWLVGARPGVGKSTFALQWAYAAAKDGLAVKFLSLEMPVEDLLKRLIASEGRIRHRRLVRGGLDEFERHVVIEAAAQIGPRRLQMRDTARSMHEVCAAIAEEDNKADLVVIDYLGLIDSGDRYENRNVEVSAISRRLKLAAMDNRVPILALHQLNRALESENRRPQLNDLRDSGTLEQDADVVLLLDSPARRSKGKDASAPKEQVDVLIAKQRNGVWGMEFGLWLEADFCRFREMERGGKYRTAEGIPA